MSDFEGLREEIQTGIQSGRHFGAQAAVSLNGKIQLNEALGLNAPFQPLQRGMMMLWLSACKPLAGVAAGILMERGELDLDTPVAHWIPDFASRKKDRITPRHLLTHTAGIRGATLGWTPRPWEDIIGRLCYIKPEPHWEPGEKAGYHVDSAWYLLGELVRRLDGRTYDRFVKEEIFDPLDMPSCRVGMPEEDFERLEDRIALMYDTSSGIPEEQEDLTAKESIICCRPGGNGRGPAEEFLQFYQAMHAMTGGEDGILKADTARNLVKKHRVGMEDKTFRKTIDWGLGFMRQSDHYSPGDTPYQFGTHASESAFGHCGNQSTAAFCDPEHGLCAVVLFNGMPGEEAHQERMRSALDALYADLDLV